MSCSLDTSRLKKPDWEYLLGRDMVSHIHHEGGLTHGGTGRQDEEVGVLEAGKHAIEIAEAGRHAAKFAWIGV